MKFLHRTRFTEYEVLDIILYKGPPLHEGSKFYYIENNTVQEADFQYSCITRPDHQGTFFGGNVVLYSDDDNMWARPAAEFFDGRFERC